MLLKTFPRGGSDIPQRKEATKNKAIAVCPAPKRAVISVNQHIGTPCEPVVDVGDSVKIGQKIGESAAYISAPIHASVSGEVVGIEDYTVLDGTKARCIVIENDGLEQLYAGESSDYTKMSPQQIVSVIKDAGIVGMGGAGFPTHVKLSPAKPVDTVIINGAECEPYLTCDHRLMVQQPAAIIDGLKAMMKALGAKRGIIGIENNKPDAVKIMKNMADISADISVVPLKVKYPQGAEKQLIKAVLEREVPSGCLPAEVGCIVSNVHTAVSVTEAINQGIGLYQRVLTVSGSLIHDPRNVLVRIGTPIKQVIDFCGGMIKPPPVVIAGGPMTGKPIVDLSAPVVKCLSGILVLREDEIDFERNDPCIRCARCVDSCPIGLQPNFLADLCEKGLIETAEDYHIMDCIECGLCSFICPAYRGLCNSIKKGKTALKMKKSVG